jgi:hypothetical protein
VQYKMRLICTLFSKNRFFPLGFSDGVFDEAYALAVIAQGGVL